MITAVGLFCEDSPLTAGHEIVRQRSTAGLSLQKQSCRLLQATWGKNPRRAFT